MINISRTKSTSWKKIKSKAERYQYKRDKSITISKRQFQSKVKKNSSYISKTQAQRYANQISHGKWEKIREGQYQKFVIGISHLNKLLNSVSKSNLIEVYLLRSFTYVKKNKRSKRQDVDVDSDNYNIVDTLDLYRALQLIAENKLKTEYKWIPLTPLMSARDKGEILQRTITQLFEKAQEYYKLENPKDFLESVPLKVIKFTQKGGLDI